MSMTHRSELTLSMYADGELSSDDMVATELHLATCLSCRARLDALRGEAGVLALALAHDAELVAVPAFQRPVSLVDFAAITCGALLVAVLVTLFATKAPALLGDLLPVAVTWFDPFDALRIADVAIGALMFVAERGGAIVTLIAQAATAAVLAALIGWIAFARRRRIAAPLMLSCLLCVVMLQPVPSHALEIRGDATGTVFIPADETIDDTLIAFGEFVEVNGDVTGDLIAVGRRVAIRGRVGGQLFTAAQTVTVDGEVEGSVLSLAAATLGVSSARIGRNLFGLGPTINLSQQTNIEQNALVFSERANVAGTVGRDVLGFTEAMEVASTIGGALTAHAKRITLLAPTRVAGDVSARVPNESALTISPGAVIEGELEIELGKVPDERSRYATAEFYLVQLLRFAAAFVTGAVLLALVPGLRRLPLDSAGHALVASGLGLIALVAAPIIAILIAITIVGIPLAVLGFLLWIAGVYLGKVVLAHFIGARLMAAADNPWHFTIALALGLVLVILVINLPFVGGALSFVLTVCGLGLLVLFVWRGLRGDPPTAATLP